MQLARVIGNLVSTVKNEALEARKFLIVQTLDADLQPKGNPLVALDAVGAGFGELVFWCRGKEASFRLNATTRRPTARSLESLIRTRTFIKRIATKRQKNSKFLLRFFGCKSYVVGQSYRKRRRHAEESALRRRARDVVSPDYA
jgi:microcompartment protein CcmK/EutM